MKINRRKFIISSSIAAGALVAGSVAVEELSKQQAYTNSVPPYEALVYGTPKTGYRVVTPSGIIFSGSCSEGTGTCGIFEAINYLQQNYGFGVVKLLGQFYPVQSPTANTQNVRIIGENAEIYISPSSAQAFIQLLPLMEGVKVLWYSNLGVVNKILEHRPSFSLQPYVLFTNTSQSLLFINGDQSLGTPSQFTVSFWAYANPGGYAGTLVSYGSTEQGAAWTVRTYQGKLLFTGSPGEIAGTAIQSKEYHIAVTYDNGDATLYVNGNRVASGSLSINYPSKAYLWIWNFPIYSQQGGPTPPSWYGYVENVQFYNEVLSDSQISTLASSPTQDPVSPSVSFWALYRYIMFIGDLISGVGFQRMGGLLLSGVF